MRTMTTLTTPPYRLPRNLERGQCFANAIYFVQINRGWDVVHGIPLGRGPIEGRRYAHGWCEITHGGLRWVCDPYLDVIMPAAVFYALDAIEYTVTYTRETALALVEETEHGGPWDEKINQTEGA